MKLKNIFLGLLFILSLGVGAAIGWIAKDQTEWTLKPIREGGYKYINPLLFCEAESNEEFKNLQTLKELITRYIAEKKEKNTLQTASIYFRDYKIKEWLDIGGDEKYAPASLLKVPIMITYLKLNEKNPAILSQTFTFNETRDYNQSQYFRAIRSIQPEKTYSVEELLRFMILYSDNNALKLLSDHIDVTALKEAYTDVGLEIPLGLRPPSKDDNLNGDFLKVKDYAYFFRLLYNSTYLNRELSEKALEWLSQADFPNGIAAKVPANIKVAQKFGERSVINSNVKELHDCGIVYYPNRPYLLCVMTKGDDFQKLEKVIQDISKMAYEFIDHGN